MWELTDTKDAVTIGWYYLFLDGTVTVVNMSKLADVKGIVKGFLWGPLKRQPSPDESMFVVRFE